MTEKSESSARGKTAIICAGGSIRSAHAAGFMYTLGKELRCRRPDIVIGSSGSAVITSYFISGQYDFLRRAFVELLPTRRFMWLLRIRPVINVDYLIDDVVKKIIPLDISAIRNGPTRSLIPVTDATNGEIRYVSDVEHFDYCELLRATCAIPILYGKEISLFGRKYVDGAICASVQDHIDAVVSTGATRILLIDDSRPRTILKRLSIWILAPLLRKSVRKTVLIGLSRSSDIRILRDIECMRITTPILPLGVVSHNKKKVWEAWELGAQSALAHAEEIRTLLA